MIPGEIVHGVILLGLFLLSASAGRQENATTHKIKENKMKNYKQTASDVLRLVGGEKNVVQVEHCSTRLRFTLADTSKVDAAALKKTAGVMGVISSGPQCQVVIGNDVIEVYDELLKLGTFNAGQAAAPAAPKGKKEIGGIILDYMVGIFQPLVPAIAGAGVLNALMVLLSTLGLMSSGDIAYKVFVGVADAALYYLPVMVCLHHCNQVQLQQAGVGSSGCCHDPPQRFRSAGLPRAVLTSSASSCRTSLTADRYSRLS